MTKKQLETIYQSPTISYDQFEAGALYLVNNEKEVNRSDDMKMEITISECVESGQSAVDFTVYEVELIDRKTIQGEGYCNPPNFQWVLAEDEMYLYNFYLLSRKDYPEYYL